MAKHRESNLIRVDKSLPETTPWDLEALSAPPGFDWVDRDTDVHSLLYEGEPLKGNPTQVFAYYASPSTLGEGEGPFPAVVLVHGGGGTAFDQWARLWAQRGYAAIAMDLAGCGAGRAPLENGGPPQTDEYKFGKIDGPVTDQWTYHAVADVILAHSLIRSFDEVDASRTAVTGISWGGYLTCIVSGLDNRLKAAVPVYGCGFLHEGSVWDGQFAAMTPEQKSRWVQLWDPSQYVGSATMPVFFVNGTNDFAYWLEVYARTYGLVEGKRNLRITVNMPHGHEVGWAPKEIGMFIDEHLLGAIPLPKVTAPVVIDGKARATVASVSGLKWAHLHYTTDDAPNENRQWQTIPAQVDGYTIVADPPPTDARIWFFTVADNRDAIVSSELVFAKN